VIAVQVYVKYEFCMGSIETGPAHTARGAATRARIVDAAADLMRANGVANTSLDAVLAASGSSKSQLYHYFANKDDLVLAVIQRQSEVVLAVQESLLWDLSSLAGLRRWRDSIVKMVGQNNCAGGCPLGTLVAELAESTQPRTLLAESFARWEAYLASGFAKMRARGELRPAAEAADLATAVMTALQGGLLLAQTMRSTQPLEIALDMAIEHVSAQRT
jgi:AcrR family transcriptional regulator